MGSNTQPSACNLASFLFCITLQLLPGKTPDGNSHGVETKFVMHITKKLSFLWSVYGYVAALVRAAHMYWL